MDGVCSCRSGYECLPESVISLAGVAEPSYKLSAACVSSEQCTYNRVLNKSRYISGGEMQHFWTIQYYLETSLYFVLYHCSIMFMFTFDKFHYVYVTMKYSMHDLDVTWGCSDQDVAIVYNLGCYYFYNFYLFDS